MKKIGRKGVPGSKWYMKKKSETYDTFWKGQAVKCDEEEELDMQPEFLAGPDPARSPVLGFRTLSYKLTVHSLLDFVPPSNMKT